MAFRLAFHLQKNAPAAWPAGGSAMLPLLTRIAIILLPILAVTACGSARAPDADPNWLSVTSKAQFGNQCPDGSWVNPTPSSLHAVDCNIPLQNLGLVQPLQPLMLTADCTKKVITVRNPQPGTLDSTWEVLPDNTFDFNIEGGKLQFVDDGRGHAGCTMPTAINVFGTLNCKSRDQITIDFQANWQVGKLDSASYSIISLTKLHPDPGEVYCQVAPTCYLNAGTKLNQCM
jgi:hypothetical protein